MTEETIAARAHREGRWWVFTVPALTSTGPTGAEIVATGQSRSLRDLDADVRDVAALWLGVLVSWPAASLLGAVLLAGAALLSVALLVRSLVMTARGQADS